MPLNMHYLDRCVKENANDDDTFDKFHEVLLLRPTEKLVVALERKRKLHEEQVSGKRAKSD